MPQYGRTRLTTISSIRPLGSPTKPIRQVLSNLGRTMLTPFQQLCCSGRITLQYRFTHQSQASLSRLPQRDWHNDAGSEEDPTRQMYRSTHGTTSRGQVGQVGDLFQTQHG